MKVPPLSPPPAEGPRGPDLPAYVSNGLIGLRLKEAPIFPGICVVNGTVGVHPEKRVEAVVPVPYPLSLDIRVGEACLSEQPWTIADLRQDYDFQSAEVTSRFTCDLAGVRLGVEVTTFCSRSHPSIVGQEVRIEGPEGTDLALFAQVETAGVRGRVIGRHTSIPGEPDAAIDGAIEWRTEGGLSRC